MDFSVVLPIVTKKGKDMDSTNTIIDVIHTTNKGFQKKEWRHTKRMHCTSPTSKNIRIIEKNPTINPTEIDKTISRGTNDKQQEKYQQKTFF